MHLPSLSARLKFRLSVALGYWAIRAIFALNIRKILNRDVLDRALRSGRPVLVALWHGRLLFPMVFFRKRGAVGVAGHHRDAEIAVRIGEKFGWKFVRGSSTRGGGEAFDAMVEALRRPGAVVAITPDGPQGPWREAKGGVVRAAAETGAVIVPMSGSATRLRMLSSWDRFLLPLPFGTIIYAFGEAVTAEPGEDLEEVRRRVEAAITAAEEVADATGAVRA